MIRHRRSESGLFLMELLLNLMLFCLLCGGGLLFFIKSYNLTEHTTTLHQAVSITSSLSAIYESSDGSLEGIGKEYKRPVIDGVSLCIYFDEDYQPCIMEASKYYVLVHLTEETKDAPLRKVLITFYDDKDNEIYSLITCNYTPFTPGKEVTK